MTSAPHQGDCDCCGKTRSLTMVIAYGMDTYACNECRGVEPDESTLGEQEPVAP